MITLPLLDLRGRALDHCNAVIRHYGGTEQTRLLPGTVKKHDDCVIARTIKAGLPGLVGISVNSSRTMVAMTSESFAAILAQDYKVLVNPCSPDQLLVSPGAEATVFPHNGLVGRFVSAFDNGHWMELVA